MVLSFFILRIFSFSDFFEASTSPRKQLEVVVHLHPASVITSTQGLVNAYAFATSYNETPQTPNFSEPSIRTSEGCTGFAEFALPARLRRQGKLTVPSRGTVSIGRRRREAAYLHRLFCHYSYSEVSSLFCLVSGSDLESIKKKKRRRLACLAF